MAWTIELKSDSYGTWHPPTDIEVRNVLGVPASPGVRALGDPSQQPAVIRYEIISKTGTPATSVVATKKSVFPGDAYNPMINLVGVSIPVTPDFVVASAQVGDVFEVGYGYRYQAALNSWCPVRSFGLLLPGTGGMVMGIRLTNAFTVPQVFSLVSWLNSGTPQFWYARLGEGEGDWKSPSEGELYLQDDSEISGVVYPTKSCIVEFYPLLGDDAVNSNNPVILTVSINSFSI